jgi:hypothetical protein
MKGINLKPPFPDKILRLMDPDVRKGLGKHFRTMTEINSQNEYLNERKLHAQIKNLLNLKGVVYLEQRMDKKSRGVKGWPDFTFAVLLNKPSKADPVNVTMVPVPCGWECKVGNSKLRPEQEELLRRLQAPPNAWRCRVIRSLQEAADELKELGI